MGYSTNAVRRAMALAMVSIGLFQMPVRSTYSERLPVVPAQARAKPALKADRQTRDRAREAYGKLPLGFEENIGQTDSQVKFFSRGSGYNLFLTPTEAVLASPARTDISHQSMTPAMTPAAAPARARAAVRMKLIGGNPAPQIEGLDVLPGTSNYFIGNDPSKWRRNVTSYARVRYRNVYRGIDLIYYGNQRQIEYDFVVAPGADPRTIKLRFGGAKQIEVDQRGDLVLQTAGGEVRQRKPVTYQETGGRQKEIASRYVMTGRQEVRFEIGAYDRTRPLVIDPVLVYSTFLGGISPEQDNGIAVDSDGHAYITGATGSSDFPTTNHSQPRGDLFVVKLNREGSAIIYSAFLGGSGSEAGSGIVVDRDGSAYVTGSTSSLDFPTTNPLQPILAGSFDVFVTRLSPDGSALLYSTYLGGTGYEDQPDVAIDGSGGIYLTGQTDSSDFPTKNPLQPAYKGGVSDGFVARLKADGSALIYSTYLGSSTGDFISRIKVDRHGNAYVAGTTVSTDFPTVNALQPESGGFLDAVLAKLNPDGTALVFSTYFGGEEAEACTDLDLDPDGNIYLMGYTYSDNFPTANAFQPKRAGSADIFITKLNQSGSNLIYSTYLGGTGLENCLAGAVDPKGNVYLTGQTYPSDYPTIDSVQPKPDRLSGTGDAFVTKLNAAGSALVYSSYLGGSNDDIGRNIAVDARGNAYVTGGTNSEDFSITREAFQRDFRGPAQFFTIAEIFITKIGDRRRHHQGQDDSLNDEEQDDDENRTNDRQ